MLKSVSVASMVNSITETLYPIRISIAPTQSQIPEQSQLKNVQNTQLRLVSQQPLGTMHQAEPNLKKTSKAVPLSNWTMMSSNVEIILSMVSLIIIADQHVMMITVTE